MIDTSKQPTASRWPEFRWRFSLRGLMVFTFGVAVGLARYTSEHLWAEGMLSAVTAWIVLGLLAQSLDLWKDYRRLESLSFEQRWGWRFAIFWRSAVAFLFVAEFIFQQLVRRRAITLPRPPDDILSSIFENSSLAAIYYLCLIPVLCDVHPRSHSKEVSSSWSRSMEILGVVAVLAIGLLRILDTMLIPVLVHLSCFATMLGQSREIEAHPVGRAFAINWTLLSHSTVLASGVALVNFIATLQLARQWPRGINRRLFWIGVLVLGLAGGCTYTIWAFKIGLPSVTPFLSDSTPVQVPHRWMLATLLLGLLVTTAAYRLVNLRQCSAIISDEHGRPREHLYLHERPVLVALIVVALLAIRGRPLIIVLQWGVGSFWARLSEGLEETLFYYSPWLEYICIFLGLRMLYYCWFRKVGSPREVPPAIAPGQFLAVWLGLFLTFATAVVAWAVLGFIMWIDDFWGLPS